MIEVVESEVSATIDIPLVRDRFPGAFVLCWSLLWNAFLVRHVIAAGFAWSLTAFILVGVASTHAALCMLLNRARIRIDGERLVFAHRPIATWHNVHCKLTEIESIEPTSITKRGRGGTRTLWHVSLLMHGGGHRRLHLGLHARRDASEVATRLGEQVKRLCPVGPYR